MLLSDFGYPIVMNIELHDDQVLFASDAYSPGGPYRRLLTAYYGAEARLTTADQPHLWISMGKGNWGAANPANPMELVLTDLNEYQITW